MPVPCMIFASLENVPLEETKKNSSICILAAQEGKSVPIPNGRYMGYAKSQFDDHWYAWDVCGESADGAVPIDLLQRAKRMASTTTTTLIYQRRI